MESACSAQLLPYPLSTPETCKNEVLYCTVNGEAPSFPPPPGAIGCWPPRPHPPPPPRVVTRKPRAAGANERPPLAVAGIPKNAAGVHGVPSAVPAEASALTRWVPAGIMGVSWERCSAVPVTAWRGCSRSRRFSGAKPMGTVCDLMKSCQGLYHWYWKLVSSFPCSIFSGSIPLPHPWATQHMLDALLLHWVKTHRGLTTLFASFSVCVLLSACPHSSSDGAHPRGWGRPFSVLRDNALTPPISTVYAV